MVKVISILYTSNDANTIGGVADLNDFLWLIRGIKPKVIYKLHDIDYEKDYVHTLDVEQPASIDVHWYTYYFDMGNGTFISYTSKDKDIKPELEHIMY
ncbi:MAG: hypothetical protein ACP5GE_04985 [Thermoplasmata archaeon]|jgi:hypothetical protein|uniref:hypothetical protein n=1 Tax=Caldisericum sp. TaxID=2499687 RepID=UPI003D127863